MPGVRQSVRSRSVSDASTRDLCERLAELERRFAEPCRSLRRAEDEIALLNDRLAWAEADLAVVPAGAEEPAPLRPPR